MRQTLTKLFLSISVTVIFSLSSTIANSRTENVNKLLNHASPYLAMHGTDPVNWQEWNDSTVARARRQNKVLFVSSGYFSCHWCHVMQRESYKNKEIADFINKYFIAVKVDRELNPALDARLIDFAEITTGSAGWPLNVFITPEGYPLVAMTYVPAVQFKEILSKINSRWQKESTELKKYAASVADELHPIHRSTDAKIAAGFADDVSQRFLYNTFDYADEMQGGFGQSLKFPSAPQLSLLLDIQKNKPNPRLEKFLRLTLDQMQSQGLWDHIGGGFYRYVVDPAWQVPHFEKMLYNNALLVSIYFDAAAILKQPSYKQTAITTLEFMSRDFSTNGGALAASLSAVDDKGVEGGCYVWTRKEIKKVATNREFSIATLLWGLNRPSPLENGYHLAQKISFTDIAEQLKIVKKEVNVSIKSLNKKLFTLRNNRQCPKDDKQLAAWNGLALSAFVKAAVVTGDKKYKNKATNIKHYLETTLWQGDHLLRAVNGSKSLGTAGLEDYAYVAQGFYDYALFSKKASDMSLAHKIVTQGFKRFYTKYGWVLSENMLLKFGQGEVLMTDGPMPSPASLLAAVSLRIVTKIKDPVLKKMAVESLNVQADVIKKQPYWYATHINAIAEYQLAW